MPTPFRSLMTPKEVAAELGVTDWWVRQLINSGALRAMNIGGPGRSARWRIDRADLLAYLASRENRARDLTHLIAS